MHFFAPGMRRVSGVLIYMLNIWNAGEAGGMMPAQDEDVRAIPNIDIARVADKSSVDASVHYGTLGSLAAIFGRDMTAHRHDLCFQLHVIEQGRVDLRLDGVIYTETAPLLFWTPPGVPHAFRLDDSAQGHVLTLDRGFVRGLMDRDPSLPAAALGTPFCLSLAAAERRDAARKLGMLCRLIRAEVGASIPGERLAMEAYIGLVLRHLALFGETGTAESPTRRTDHLLFRRFLDLTEQHFTHRWPVAQYADRLAMTETRLTDLCRRCADRPPKQIILDRLLLEARRLLAFSRQSVLEIAVALGFDDPSYFSRLFRERHGQTPSQFRDSLREKS